MTIVEFLEARITEDEAIAGQAIIKAHTGYKPHPDLAEWCYDGDEVEYVGTPEMRAQKYYSPFYVTMDSEGLLPAVNEDCGAHIARHDPARVLRECEAKRVALGYYVHDDETVMNATVEAMARIYSDHPDYQQNWEN